MPVEGINRTEHTRNIRRTKIRRQNQPIRTLVVLQAPAAKVLGCYFFVLGHFIWTLCAM